MDEKKLAALANLAFWSSLLFYASTVPAVAQEFSQSSHPQSNLSQASQHQWRTNRSPAESIFMDAYGHRITREQFDAIRTKTRQLPNAALLSTSPTSVPNNGLALDPNPQHQAEEMFSGHSFDLDLAPVDNELHQQFEADVVRGQPRDLGAIVSKGIARVIYNSAAKRTLNDDIIETKALRTGTLRRDLYDR